MNSVLMKGEKDGALFADPAHRQWILVFPLHAVWVLTEDRLSERGLTMKKWISTLRRFFATRPVNAENSAQRVLESILPVASLYGVDVANIDPEWFHDKTSR
ncbi:hypothetical protein CIW55_03560 [Enterobacter cloacae]|nr:hypothetical protein CIW55_03560 [Enterobacter cloacae]PAO17106.1 hypothetical protein CIW58_00030 [Enterobacter cloacae]